jgi:hypothetical protein
MLCCQQISEQHRGKNRRDGRVVEGARLESVYRGNSIEGSNPSLSAIIESITCFALPNFWANVGQLGIQRSMPLALYRRHRQNCKAGYKHNTRTSEYDERKKGRPQCEFPIFISGSLQREFRRHNTGKWEWTDARAIAQEFEDTGSWTGIPEPPPPDTEVPKPARVTIDRAVKAFKAEFEEHAATSTQKKYRILLAKPRTFAESKGYIMLDQWTPMDIREMRASWDVAPQTAAKNMSTVKAFFEFCGTGGRLSRRAPLRPEAVAGKLPLLSAAHWGG